MALGNRTLYGQMMHEIYAGLPRDRNTELATETVAKLGAVFGLPATTKTKAKHPNKKHRSQAFNAEAQRRPWSGDEGAT